MQVLLFRALKDANVEDDKAAAVVAAIEEHVDVAVGQANKALEAKLDGIKMSVDAVKAGNEQMRVWMVIITSILAIIALLGSVASVVVARVRKSAAPRADMRPDGEPPMPSPPPSDRCIRITVTSAAAMMACTTRRKANMGRHIGQPPRAINRAPYGPRNR